MPKQARKSASSDVRAPVGDVTVAGESAAMLNGDAFPPPPPLDDLPAAHLPGARDADLPPPPPCVLRAAGAVVQPESLGCGGALAAAAGVTASGHGVPAGRAASDTADRAPSPRVDNALGGVVSPSSSSSSDGVSNELAAAMLSARLRAEPSNQPSIAVGRSSSHDPVSACT